MNNFSCDQYVTGMTIRQQRRCGCAKLLQPLPQTASSGPFIVGKYHQTQKNRQRGCAKISDAQCQRINSQALRPPRPLSAPLAALPVKTYRVLIADCWRALWGVLPVMACTQLIARLPNFWGRSRARTAQKPSRARVRWVSMWVGKSRDLVFRFYQVQMLTNDNRPAL